MPCRSTKNSQALLFYAVSSGNLEMMKLLLNLSLELNFQDWEDTPELDAIRAGHRQIIELMIERGALLHTVSTHGKIAHELLKEFQPDMLQTSRKRKASDCAAMSPSELGLLTHWELGSDDTGPIVPPEFGLAITDMKFVEKYCAQLHQALASLGKRVCG